MYHRPEARKDLRFRQLYSGPVIDQLHAWLTAQFTEKKVEPNSRSWHGDAVSAQTLDPPHSVFARGRAPIDNNVCERALKRAILHGKNSLFYKTENGARVGDLFMSLIHT